MKPRADGCTLRLADGTSGAAEFLGLTDVAPGQLADCYGVFQSAKDARKALTEIARGQSLCLKVLGLEQSSGSCFGYQVGKCKGSCIGQEPLALHSLRAQIALSSLKLKAWPFPGRVALRERAAFGADELHVLDHWSYVGTARSDEELAALTAKQAPGAFDAHVYRILVRYFANHPKLDWYGLTPADGPRTDIPLTMRT
jgi:DNA polymerase III subunit epsilon